MTTASASDIRKNFKTYLEKATSQKEPIKVQRRGAEAVMMISESEYLSLQETLYLLSSPANAQSLRKSQEEADKGLIITHKIIE